MPSFLYMKILESTPERYDRGIRILSRGRIDGIYEQIAGTVSGKGKKILDIGCGTGNLSLACASRGSQVTGIDINSGMLEIAKKKAEKAGSIENVEFLEIGVAEMRSRFENNTMDACVSCLAFSEMTPDEQKYAISSANSILKPGGVLIIADETIPGSAGKRVLHSLVQAPVRILAYILTQSGTRPLKDIGSKLQDAKFVGVETNLMWNDSFLIVKGHKRKVK